MNDSLDRLRLIRTEGVGPLTYRRLLARFGTAADAIAALPDLARAGGRPATAIPSRADAERELTALAKLGGQFLFLETPTYPPLLADLADAPPAIAILGDPTLLQTRAIGIVGARNASANGMRLAEQLAANLAAESFTIISGLARGIDAAAHTGALSTGRTIAVIAGGLDLPYPPENANLQARIAENGVVVAESPLGTAPLARHFPRRNRIIAGLVLGLVVIEAAQRSGSLLTARLANEAGRELFAVPGSPLDARCKGSNDLIRQGANLTETAADVLANLPDHPARQGLARDPLFRRGALAEPVPAPPAPQPDANDIAIARSRIPALLGPDPVAVDEIARRCQLSTAAISAVLLELELAGRVETLPGNRVAQAANL